MYRIKDQRKWVIYLDGVLLKHVNAKISQARLQAMLQDWKIYVVYDDIESVMHVHHYE